VTASPLKERRPDLVVQHHMSDAAEASYNGWSHSFSSERLMCYSHVYRGVAVNANGITDVTVRKQFLFDFGTASRAWTTECREKLLELLYDKYESNVQVTEVIAEYKRVWLTERLKKHYSGVCHGWNVNNSGLEGKNGDMKERITDFKTLPLIEYMTKFAHYIRMESISKDPNSANYDPYEAGIKVPRSIYKSVVDIHQAKITSVWNSGNDGDNVYVVVNKKTFPKFDEVSCLHVVSKYHQNSWASWDEHIQCTASVKVLEIIGANREGSMTYTCTCYSYSREHYCKHGIYVLFKLGHTYTTAKVKFQMPVARTKKAAGAPAKAKAALLLQPIPFGLPTAACNSSKPLIILNCNNVTT
jgi:hypothetical protein